AKQIALQIYACRSGGSDEYCTGIGAGRGNIDNAGVSDSTGRGKHGDVPADCRTTGLIRKSASENMWCVYLQVAASGEVHYPGGGTVSGAGDIYVAGDGYAALRGLHRQHSAVSGDRGVARVQKDVAVNRDV